MPKKSCTRSSKVLIKVVDLKLLQSGLEAATAYMARQHDGYYREINLQDEEAVYHALERVEVLRSKPYLQKNQLKQVLGIDVV